MASRALYGFAICGLFIVAQSWLNDAVGNAIRGRVMAIFYICYIVGLGLGSLTLSFIPIDTPAAPIVAVCFAALSIIPVGLTSLRPPPAPESASIAIAQAWRISPVGLAGMLAVGGLSKTYQPLEHISLMKRIREQLPKAGMIFIGGGELDDEVRRAELSQPGRHIEFTGDLPRAETIEVIRRADVFLRLTLWDGDSVSLREAVHLGIPAVATDNGMRPDGVHLVSGIDDDSIPQLVESLAEIKGDRTVASHDANIRAVVELYGELTGTIDRPSS